MDYYENNCYIHIHDLDYFFGKDSWNLYSRLELFSFIELIWPVKKYELLFVMNK